MAFVAFLIRDSGGLARDFVRGSPRTGPRLFFQIAFRCRWPVVKLSFTLNGPQPAQHETSFTQSEVTVGLQSIWGTRCQIAILASHSSLDRALCFSVQRKIASTVCCVENPFLSSTSRRSKFLRSSCFLRNQLKTLGTRVFFRIRKPFAPHLRFSLLHLNLAQGERGL